MGRVLLLWFTALLASASAAVEIKELTDPTESIYFTKSGDVAVIGLFDDAKSKQYRLFKQVASDLEGGIAYGTSVAKPVITKYREEDGAPSETPFLVAFHPFNPESGRVKKGKKSKMYFTGPFTYAAMHEFILTSSVPVVTRLPANDGPDVQRRNAQAIQNMHPKLFMFSKTTEVPDEFLAAARGLRDRLLAFHVTVQPGAKGDEGARIMKGLKLDPAALKAKDSLVAFVYEKAFTYTGGLSDLAELSEFVADNLKGKPEYAAQSPRVGKEEL